MVAAARSSFCVVKVVFSIATGELSEKLFEQAEAIAAIANVASVSFIIQKLYFSFVLIADVSDDFLDFVFCHIALDLRDSLLEIYFNIFDFIDF